MSCPFLYLHTTLFYTQLLVQLMGQVTYSTTLLLLITFRPSLTHAKIEQYDGIELGEKNKIIYGQFIKSIIKAIKCACLGTVLDVPLSTVAVLENVSMAFMALMMLLMN